MDIMQGPDNFIWSIAEWALIVLSVVGVWFLTTVGRKGSPENSEPEEETTDYGDGIKEGHAGVSRFLIGTYVLVGIWGVAYLVWTGLHGTI